MKVITFAIFTATVTASMSMSPVYTTSTIYATTTATVTSCPPKVSVCPEESKTHVITTLTIPLTTTVCPVTGKPIPTYTKPDCDDDDDCDDDCDDDDDDCDVDTTKVTNIYTSTQKPPFPTSSTYIITSVGTVSSIVPTTKPQTTVIPITAAANRIEMAAAGVIGVAMAAVVI